MSFVAILAASVIASVLSATASAATAAWNRSSQEKINSQNIEAQKDINTQNVEAQAAINQQNIDYSREFAQNNIQWKMADLEAAGLNPTLAAGGFGGSISPTAMSSPVQKAPQAQAPLFDMSGVGSALTAMSNMMMTSYLLNERNKNYDERTDAYVERFLNSGVSRKANVQSTMINDAKKMASAPLPSDPDWEKKWDAIMKMLK